MSHTEFTHLLRSIDKVIEEINSIKSKRIFIVDTPGASTANLRSLPYRRVPRPIYPLDPGVRPPAGIIERD